LDVIFIQTSLAEQKLKREDTYLCIQEHKYLSWKKSSKSNMITHEKKQPVVMILRLSHVIRYLIMYIQYDYD